MMKTKFRLLTTGLILAAVSASQALAQNATNGASNGGNTVSVPDESSSLLLAGAALTGLLWAAHRKFRK